MNGVYPDYGCSRYTLSGGEVIKWRYTTNLGVDLGDDPNAGQTGKPEEGGSAILQPEVKPDKNGSAKVTVDETQMKDAIATAKTEGSSAIVIAPQVTGEANKVMTEVSTQSLKDVVKNTDAALEVQTGVGSVSIPNDALDSIARQAGGSKETVSGTCIKQNGKLSMQVKISHLSTFVVTTQKTMPFTDLSGHWAAEVITYVHGNGLMNGTSDTTFAPDESLNRAMLATILYRLSNEPAAAGEGKTFMDVAPDTWYTSAVAWASAKGDLSKFADGDQIAAWASDAMAWAVGSRLISGKTANVIDPTGTATRAEVATLLMRFTELTK